MSYSDINSSLNLVDLALNHLEFLDHIDQNGDYFYSSEVTRRAALRYELYWMPFYKSMIEAGEDPMRLYPPYDVAWIWHCHVLSPTDYAKDCMHAYGTHLDHFCFSKTEIEQRQEYTKRNWDQNMPNVPFNDDVSIPLNFDYRSKLGYDLTAASERQKKFFYNVSLPHFRDKKFLALCLTRYQKFLYLKQTNPDLFVVPCYGIDLIWHTHQLNPVVYVQETKKWLNGRIMPHDDTVSDRSHDSPLTNSFNMTKEAWMRAFNEPYNFAGGMYRGESPKLTKSFSSRNTIDLSVFYTKHGKLELLEASLTEKKSDEKSKASAFNVKIKQKQRLIYDIILNNEEKSRWLQTRPVHYDYNQTDEASLVLSMYVVYKERTRAKLVNLLTKGESHDARKDRAFLINLQVPSRLSDELQQFDVVVQEPSGKRHFNLQTKYKLSGSQLANECLFSFKKQGFAEAHMSDVLKELGDDTFDLANRNFDGQRGECIRARHLISVLAGPKNWLELYHGEILHIPSIQWSSVRILYQSSELRASAHLIGLEQLPTYVQMQNNNYPLALNPKYEKAMLVRNGGGDYAIIKGKWVGFRRGVAPSRNQRAVRGDPGYLQLQVYFMSSKTTLTNLNLPRNFKFDFKTGGSSAATARVDLQTGMFGVTGATTSTETESLMACVFAISVLHVLLQPKQSPYVAAANAAADQANNNNTSSRVNTVPTYRGNRPVRSINSDNYVMFSLIGYNELIHSHCFLHFCHHHHHHHHPDHCHEASVVDPDCHNNHTDHSDGHGNEHHDCGDGNNQDSTSPWINTECETSGGGGDSWSGGDSGGGSDNSSGGGDFSAGCGGCNSGGADGGSSCGSSSGDSGGGGSSCGSSGGDSGGGSSCGSGDSGGSSCGSSGGSSCGSSGGDSGGGSSCGSSCSSGGGSSCGSSCGGGGGD